MVFLVSLAVLYIADGVDVWVKRAQNPKGNNLVFLWKMKRWG